MKNQVLSIIAVVLLTSLNVSTLGFRPVRAMSITYINADGTISPSTAPIHNDDNTIYTFMDDISGSICIARSNVIIDGNGFKLYSSDDEFGFVLNTTSGVAIRNTSISGFTYGVYYQFAPGNSLYANSLHNNTVGIYVEFSGNITIAENDIENNELGVKLLGSNSNRIERNTISQNTVGIWLDGSSYDAIVHNNFVANSDHTSVQPTSHGPIIWNLNYPLGGNYWDTYAGEDNYSGQYQNATGADGIGDTPYFLTDTERDLYPLLGRWGGPTHTGPNVAAFPTDDIALIFAEVTIAGNTDGRIDSIGPELPGGQYIIDYYEIETSAAYDGIVTIRIRYSDSGLTPEQEGGLRLLQYNPLPGDLTYDGNVSIDDVVKAISGYHARLGDPTYNPLADIAAPYEYIDIFDLVSLLIYYGDRSEPELLWGNITTRIDTESNLIYGQTTHLSIFGVTRQT